MFNTNNFSLKLQYSAFNYKLLDLYGLDFSPAFSDDG